MRNMLICIKDSLKNLAHNLPFVPYRKKSRRYRYWHARREKRFVDAIQSFYMQNKEATDNIKVSAVMPAYNRADSIGHAVSSVLNQTHQHWELIIVDDGSTDGLSQVLQPYLKDRRIALIRQDHRGVAAARNTGLQNTSGDYVFYLDTDNTWRPEYLGNMITFMEAGHLDACYSGVHILGDDPAIVSYYGEDFDWEACFNMNYIDLNAFGHKRSLLHSGLQFDEKLKRLVDWDFILAATAEHRVAYAPFIGVDYYDGRRGNRITFTEYPGDELTKHIESIQKKFKGLKDSKQVRNPAIRPRWKQVLQSPGKP